MKTAGIIAEYNPFHNGHQYQMETVRHLTGADFVTTFFGAGGVTTGVVFFGATFSCATG